MTPIISVRGISKRYKLGQIQGYKTIRESFSNLFHPRKSLSPASKFLPLEGGGVGGGEKSIDHIWALKDVSFDVQPGEVIGIIGRNGAGKSTLLKILTRITEPTEGTARMRGQVASLLEVGTGFHPELTGRENVYLNGAILGMRKADIDKKFDEIIAFAEVGRFVDTPVKRYSSGMYLRLAFAVAAHLEPEILLVDEVLAVGDASFQRKCLDKMGNVAKEGRTILFVSHNMQAIRQLCPRALLLESGMISADGAATEVIEKYLRNLPRVETATSLETLIRQLPPDPVFRLVSIVFTQGSRPVTGWVLNGQSLEVEISYRVLESVTGLRVYFDLCDTEGTLLFRSFHDEQSDGIPKMESGDYISRAIIPSDLLAPVSYEICVHATIFNVRTCTADGIRIPLYVERTGKANRAYTMEPIRGKIAPVIPWVTNRL